MTLKTKKRKIDPSIKDIGFVIPKLLNNNAHDHILRSVKSLIDAEIDRHICVFASYNERISTHNVPILHLNESKFFYGNLFLFDITSIVLTQNCPNIHARYWYAENIPWTEHISGSYQEWYDIFMKDNLSIIAKNKEINDIYSICWKTPVGIMEEFNHESIIKIL
jgi:hypothetical protein